MLNTISNTPNTSFVQRGAKASYTRKKEIQIKNKENREMIRHWLKKPGNYLNISASIELPQQIEIIRTREATARIRMDVIEKHSQSFTNVSEERYQSAKAYLYQQMEEIALAVYEEEGDTDFLGMLILLGGHNMSAIERADKVFNEELEFSAREFVESLKTKDEQNITEAQGKLEHNLTTTGVASMIALPSMLGFFTLADSKIPAENLQKIKDSLGIMRSYIEDNYNIIKAPIKTKNGFIIESHLKKGIRTLSVTLPFDKVENLILGYQEKNHQTLLEMFKYKEKFSSDTINSKDLLMQTLLKEGKEKSIDKDRQTL